MTFPASAYLLAVLGGALATFASLPLWRAWCVRTGLVDDPGQRKIHNTPIPLAGGLAVLTGLLLPLLAGAVAMQLGLLPAGALEKISYGFEKRGLQLAAILRRRRLGRSRIHHRNHELLIGCDRRILDDQL